MRIKYKKVKIAMAHCGDCGQMLFGNNSLVTPYRCNCGEWESSFREPFEFTLKSEREK